MRESVIPLTTTPKVPPAIIPQLPIDAIREAVRAEMAAVPTIAANAAIQAQVAAANKVFSAIAMLLAVRLLLLLALLGGFVIAVMAIRDGGYQAAGILVAYATLFILPLTWLERNPRTSKTE
jgi:hypothetical protein